MLGCKAGPEEVSFGILPCSIQLPHLQLILLADLLFSLLANIYSMAILE